MKQFFACLFLISLLSCKKDKKPADPNIRCYRCELYGNGTMTIKDTCMDKNVPPVFKDAQGNNLNYVCNEK
jgi:hypothetical protein